MKAALTPVPRRPGRAEWGQLHNRLFATEGPREAPILSRRLRNFIAALPPWSGNRHTPDCAPASENANAACRRVKRGWTAKGRGVMARFDITSFELTEIAAAGSTPDALLELGLLYCAGRDDVAIDLVSAHKWFNLAAIRGNAEAKHYRMEIAREMSKREIAEAQRRARAWLARH